MLNHVADVVFNFWKVHYVSEGEISVTEVWFYVLLASQAGFRPLKMILFLIVLAFFII